MSKIYKTFDDWFDDNYYECGHESYHDARRSFESRQQEIDQLKQAISGFEKLMAENILIPNDEYASLIATIKKEYNPNYVMDTNQKIVAMHKEIDQLKQRILELEKENQRLKELSGN